MCEHPRNKLKPGLGRTRTPLCSLCGETVPHRVVRQGSDEKLAWTCACAWLEFSGRTWSYSEAVAAHNAARKVRDEPVDTEERIELLTYDDSSNAPSNVVDRFANMTTEQIREALESGLSSMVTICMNLTSDFNKATVLRAHNAFLGREFYVVGRKTFDRRGTVGMHHYTTVKYSETVEPIIDALRAEGYTIFAVDNTPEFSPVAVYDASIPEKSAFIYGEEQLGLDKATVALCDQAVYIPQRGVPRSLNVSNAAAIMMSEYTRRHNFA